MDKRQKIYWWLQALGWTVFFAVNLVFAVAFKFFNTSAIQIVLLNCLILFTYTHGLRAVIKRRGWKNIPIWSLITRLVGLNGFASLLSQFLISVYMVHVLGMFKWPNFSWTQLIGYSLNTFIVLSGWCLLYFLIHFFRNYKNEEIEKWKLQSALNEAELNALKAQINPHFIFNCLNNIRAMILDDGGKARQMLLDLSELLRYSFQFTDAKFVNMGVEMRIVEQYLALEKIQFDERLDYQIDCDVSLEDLRVPSFSILTLVENAIKHGLSNLKGGGKINVAILSQGKEIEVSVRNSGSLVNNSNPGTGLDNLRGRIQMLYNSSASFDLSQEDGMVLAKLVVPKQVAK